MPLDNGEIYKSLVNRTPYLILHPSQAEQFRRDFPYLIVKGYETIPLQMDSIQQAPRNRHERRKTKKLKGAS